METIETNTNTSEKRGFCLSDLWLIAAGAASIVSALVMIISNFVLPEVYPRWIDTMLYVIFFANLALSVTTLIATHSFLLTIKLLWKVASSGWKLFGITITWWGLLLKVVAFIITAWVALILALIAFSLPIIPVMICRFRDARANKELGELFGENDEEDERRGLSIRA